MVVTEGGYLLLDEPPWWDVAALLDECWYLDVADDVRRTRLQARHERLRPNAGARPATAPSAATSAAPLAVAECWPGAVIGRPTPIGCP